MMNEDDAYDKMREDAGDWLELMLDELLNEVEHNDKYSYYRGKDMRQKVLEHSIQILQSKLDIERDRRV